MLWIGDIYFTIYSSVWKILGCLTTLVRYLHSLSFINMPPADLPPEVNKTQQNLMVLECALMQQPRMSLLQIQWCCITTKHIATMKGPVVIRCYKVTQSYNNSTYRTKYRESVCLWTDLIPWWYWGRQVTGFQSWSAQVDNDLHHCQGFASGQLSNKYPKLWHWCIESYAYSHP